MRLFQLTFWSAALIACLRFVSLAHGAWLFVWFIFATASVAYIGDALFNKGKHS